MTHLEVRELLLVRLVPEPDEIQEAVRLLEPGRRAVIQPQHPTVLLLECLGPHLPRGRHGMNREQKQRGVGWIRETDTFNDKQSQTAERKTGDGRGPGDHSSEAG